MARYNRNASKRWTAMVPRHLRQLASQNWQSHVIGLTGLGGWGRPEQGAGVGTLAELREAEPGTKEMFRESGEILKRDTCLNSCIASDEADAVKRGVSA